MQTSSRFSFLRGPLWHLGLVLTLLLALSLPHLSYAAPTTPALAAAHQHHSPSSGMDGDTEGVKDATISLCATLCLGADTLSLSTPPRRQLTAVDMLWTAAVATIWQPLAPIPAQRPPNPAAIA